jgi:2,4-dienoyl-CoA reductase-like NADH-dependent reductase (Old Yellow Enzyme family)
MQEGLLFSPFVLKNFKLKNRIGVAPMTRMSSPGDSIPRKDVLEFLVRRAKNGAAVVYTEAIVTDFESAQGYPGQARLVTERQIEAWRPVVRAIQINPARRVLAPSSLTPRDSNPLTGKPYPVPDAMSQFDIDHVILGFVETAKGAIAAGFDGVEIHGAHGYLISQFLSAYSNQRTDVYGGSVANRYRFAHEVIQAVAGVIPENKLLTFRISDWGVVDIDVSLFQRKEEYQEVIAQLSREPLDTISVSTYDYQQRAFGTDQNMAQVTREKTSLPIMICGKIYDRTTAEDALRDADIVLSAKSMLLNPDWVEDVRLGKPLPLYKSEETNIAYTETRLP